MTILGNHHKADLTDAVGFVVEALAALGVVVSLSRFSPNSHLLNKGMRVG